MKYISKILAVFCLAGMALSCQTEEPFLGGNGVNPEVGVFGDEMTLSLNMVASDQLSVNTKAVDPDGVGIKNMTFFCFDADGYFLQTAEAVLTAESVGKEEGIIATVKVPNKSRIMHVICNLQMGTFDDEAYEGVAEDEVINSIEATSGLLLYWARIQVPANVLGTYPNVTNAAKRSEAEAVLDWITIETNPSTQSHKGVAGKGNPIHLIRNQAKITVSSANTNPNADPWTGDKFVVTGFNVYNSNAIGTIAPRDAEYGYPSFGASYGVGAWSMANTITVPDNVDILDEIGQVDTFKEKYIFETANSVDSPVEVIIRGYNIIDGQDQPEMYYKAEILDADKGLLPIRRNHHYQFTITGNMYNGSATFDGAVAGPAANNIWLTIADEVTSVVDGSFRLSVDEYLVTRSTKAVEADPVLNLGFEVQKLGAIEVDPSLISVEWVDADQNVAEPINLASDVTYDSATGKGNIKVTLKALPAGSHDVEKGTLIVRYRQLFRRIEVIVTPIFDFIPVYASSEGIEGQRDHVTLVYTVPDTYPAELFPFNVLISTNDLNVRSSSGQKLSIVVKGDEGYGESFEETVGEDKVTDTGYKYVMPVTSPGVQRIYLETLEDEVLENITYHVALESQNFNRHIESVVVDNTKYSNYIEVENALEYNDNGASVNYILVPPKKHAPVTFELATMAPGDPATTVGVTAGEEFLLYSKNLDHYADDDPRLDDEFKAQFDCTFAPYRQETWVNDGRVFGFYPRADIPTGKFEVYMETNSPKADEVIFVVSNNHNSPSVKNGSENYTGELFRSATFELSNYHPFNFSANIITSKSEEVFDDEVVVDVNDASLKLYFDITSFEGADGKSVDPFGTAFEVYIDAPMFEIDTDDQNMVNMANHYHYGNPILEQTEDGRIIYRVYSNREDESLISKQFGAVDAAVVDPKAESQKYERKYIALRPKSKTAVGGSITISADPEIVTFNSQTFDVTCKALSFDLKFGTDEANAPVGHSVSFYNKATGDRIYSTTVSQAGKCDFRFNLSRPFDLDNDVVTMIMQHGGKYYSADVIIADLTVAGAEVVLAE